MDGIKRLCFFIVYLALLFICLFYFLYKFLLQNILYTCWFISTHLRADLWYRRIAKCSKNSALLIPYGHIHKQRKQGNIENLLHINGNRSQTNVLFKLTHRVQEHAHQLAVYCCCNSIDERRFICFLINFDGFHCIYPIGLPSPTCLVHFQNIRFVVLLKSFHAFLFILNGLADQTSPYFGQ